MQAWEPDPHPAADDRRQQVPPGKPPCTPLGSRETWRRDPGATSQIREARPVPGPVSER